MVSLTAMKLETSATQSGILYPRCELAIRTSASQSLAMTFDRSHWSLWCSLTAFKDGTECGQAQVGGGVAEADLEEKLLEHLRTGLRLFGVATTINDVCKAAFQPPDLRGSMFAELAIGVTLPALMEDEPFFGAAFAHDRTIARWLLATMGKI